MSHQFAIYVSDFIIKESEIVITNPDFYRRIVNVLRLKIGDGLVIFNNSYSYNCTVKEINKKVILQLLETNKISYLEPKLNIIIGLLKKEDFEQAICNATIIGAYSIKPILTERIHRNWWSDKYLQRLENIMVSAAEQSKNFALPKLYPPIKLTDCLNKLSENTLVCDPIGEPLYKKLAEKDKFTDLSLIIGPEGGFSGEEEQLLVNLSKIALTPTILKSVDAVLVAGGVIRNVL